MGNSRESVIRTEIRRRLLSGETMSYRAIRLVTGGSNSTIQRVMGEVLGGDAQSSPTETPVAAEAPEGGLSQLQHLWAMEKARADQLEAELRTSHAQIAQLSAMLTKLQGMPDAVQQAIEQLAYLQDRADQTYRRLMVEIDTFRIANIPRQDRPDTEGGAQEGLGIPAAEGLVVDKRVRALTAANATLSERVERLMRQLHDAGLTPIQ